MELQAGEIFANRYRLIREVGQGAFGEVWLVWDEQLDLELALKVYVALDERGIEEFKDEYKTPHALNHPNLLHATYFDVYEKRPYLVMPYCPLSAVDLVGKMDDAMAWRFIRDVSGGLACLHSKNILHREIMPDNILINGDGDFVIIDFGSSIRRHSLMQNDSLRDTDPCVGVLGYMGPEMFAAKPRMGKAADIWALGAALFELLQGELPFMGQGGAMQLYGATIPEMSERYENDLIEVVRICMACNPVDRPTATQLFVYADAKMHSEHPVKTWEKKTDVSETQRRVIEEKDFLRLEVRWQLFVEQEKRKIWGTETRKITFEDRSIRVGEVEFEMVYVEGGTFTMGGTSEQGSDAFDDEKPTHRVTLSAFHIGKYEVTQGLWREVMGSNPSLNKAGDDYPVERVSWEDCQEFVRKLNARTGLKFRLPTEAEWEYAARGGRKSRGYKYSGSNSLGDVAWYEANSGGGTHPVGRKSPNELGLYDMSGNVWEWCQDWYGDYGSSSQTDPAGPSSGSIRVMRGGGCDYARRCRVSYRINCVPGYRNFNSGLRLVLEM